MKNSPKQSENSFFTAVLGHLGSRARVTMMLLVNYSSRSVSFTIFHDKNDETCPKPLK
jgi:hypothetical protein